MNLYPIAVIGSAIAFITSLFVLYRVLVSGKDATIESLREKINLPQAKLDAAAEIEPSNLLMKVVGRESVYEKEMERDAAEMAEQLRKNEDLERRLAGSLSPAEKGELSNALQDLSKRYERLYTDHNNLMRYSAEIGHPISRFLGQNAVVSPGRQIALTAIAKIIGADKVIEATPEQLAGLVSGVAADVRAGRHWGLNSANLNSTWLGLTI